MTLDSKLRVLEGSLPTAKLTHTPTINPILTLLQETELQMNRSTMGAPAFPGRATANDDRSNGRLESRVVLEPLTPQRFHRFAAWRDVLRTMPDAIFVSLDIAYGPLLIEDGDTFSKSASLYVRVPYFDKRFGKYARAITLPAHVIGHQRDDGVLVIDDATVTAPNG